MGEWISFEPLGREGFAFAAPPECDVESVSVLSVALREGDPCGALRVLRCEFAWGTTLRGAREALAARGLALEPEQVLGLQLRVRFRSGTCLARLCTVLLELPGRTNLRDTPRDRVVRRLLVEWGFDVRPREDPVVAAGERAARW